MFTAILIGDFRREEFRKVAELVRRDGTAYAAADVPQAQRLVVQERNGQGNLSPDLVVLACEQPGQFLHHDLYALKRQLPLARFLGVLGAWCEGETRTGLPWPGMSRTYWHHWLPHWSNEMQRFLDGRVTAWGLQQTAADDERSLLSPIAVCPQEGLVLVRSESFDMADMLCHACRAHGYGAVWIPPGQQAFVEGVAAVLWDAPDVDPREIDNCRSSYPNAPIVALIDFPRVEDARQAAGAGVTLVMGKPLNIDDLFGQLTRLTGSEQRLASGLWLKPNPLEGTREVA